MTTALDKLRALRGKCRLCSVPPPGATRSNPGPDRCLCTNPAACLVMVAERANLATHTLLTPDECDCVGTFREGRCNICEGGLHFCKVCKGGEQELLDQSCEERQKEQANANTTHLH